KRTSRTKESDNFRIGGQFGSEPNNRQEQKQRKQEVGKINREVKVILGNFNKRNIVFHHFTDFFVEVHHNPNRNEQQQQHDEGAQISFEYVPVEYFQITTCYPFV